MAHLELRISRMQTGQRLGNKHCNSTRWTMGQAAGEMIESLSPEIIRGRLETHLPWILHVGTFSLAVKALEQMSNVLTSSSILLKLCSYMEFGQTHFGIGQLY